MTEKLTQISKRHTIQYPIILVYSFLHEFWKDLGRIPMIYVFARCCQDHNDIFANFWQGSYDILGPASEISRVIIKLPITCVYFLPSNAHTFSYVFKFGEHGGQSVIGILFTKSHFYTLQCDKVRCLVETPDENWLEIWKKGKECSIKASRCISATRRSVTKAIEASLFGVSPANYINKIAIFRTTTISSY